MFVSYISCILKLYKLNNNEPIGLFVGKIKLTRLRGRRSQIEEWSGEERRVLKWQIEQKVDFWHWHQKENWPFNQAIGVFLGKLLACIFQLFYFFYTVFLSHRCCLRRFYISHLLRYSIVPIYLYLCCGYISLPQTCDMKEQTWIV